MKTEDQISISAAIITMIAFLLTGCATSKPVAPVELQTQNVEEPAPLVHQREVAGSEFIDRMDVKRMREMLHQCLKVQKSKRMCMNQVMDTCQENIEKAECTKMMNEAKKK